jgi:hypothetical protein
MRSMQLARNKPAKLEGHETACGNRFHTTPLYVLPLVSVKFFFS